MNKTKSFFIPKLLHILQAECHPDHHWIEKKAEAWLHRRADQLFSCEAEYQHFINYRMSWWPCWCSPHGIAERIYHISNFLNTFTVYDDVHCVRPGQQVYADLLARSSESGPAKMAQLKGIIEGKRPQDPYVLAMYDAFQEIAQRMPPDQRLRYQALFNDLIDAQVVEAEIRATGRLIDLDSYIDMKKDSGCFLLCTLYIEYALGIELPAKFLRDPQLRDLHKTFCENMLLANDIWSYPAEVYNGDWQINAITQLSEGKGIDLQDAINEMVDIIERTERHFVALRDELLTQPIGSEPGVRAYLLELGYVLSGSNHFQPQCSRYFWEEGAWEGRESGWVTISADGVKVTEAEETPLYRV